MTDQTYRHFLVALRDDLQHELSLTDDHRWIKVLDDLIKRQWVQTDDPDIIAVMGSAPECAANGCQFRKTLGYAPGKHPDFPPLLFITMTEDGFLNGVSDVAGDIGTTNAGARLRDLIMRRMITRDAEVEDNRP